MTKNRMKFNGKEYEKVILLNIHTKDEIEIEKKKYNQRGFNAIIDKRKEGYFLWIKKKMKRGK